MLRVTLTNRRAVALAAVLVTAATTVLAARAPAAEARSCAQAARLLNTGLTGTGGLSYVSGAFSKKDGDGDETQTMSLDHHASGVRFVLPKPQQGSGGVDVFGQPSGGTVTINDTFNDTGEGNDHDNDGDGAAPGQAQQTYDGPSKPGNSSEVMLHVNASDCTYDIGFGFAVPSSTTHSGSALFGTQSGEQDQAFSPAEPIPTNLHLSATATIHPSGSGGCQRACYDLSGDPDWGGTLDTLTSGSDPGTATITWDLSPTSARSGGCLVPHLRGLTKSQAASELRSAGCKLGRIRHKHSSSVHRAHVISSSPGAGTKLPTGAKVTVVLSSG